jgi:hypothetical protein
VQDRSSGRRHRVREGNARQREQQTFFFLQIRSRCRFRRNSPNQCRFRRNKDRWQSIPVDPDQFWPKPSGRAGRGRVPGDSSEGGRGLGRASGKPASISGVDLQQIGGGRKQGSGARSPADRAAEAGSDPTDEDEAAARRSRREKGGRRTEEIDRAETENRIGIKHELRVRERDKALALIPC